MSTRWYDIRHGLCRLRRSANLQNEQVERIISIETVTLKVYGSVSHLDNGASIMYGHCYQKWQLVTVYRRYHADGR
jgi:hypothetical protein